MSTIDVLKKPEDADESSKMYTVVLHPYGYNRYQLELWVREKYPDALIIRLPGLFGNNIKKNCIYDYINVIQFMLNANKYDELVSIDERLINYYKLQENGFYKVDVIGEETEKLKDIFRRLGFSALNFTDSRSVYQFYNLAHLWEDIQILLGTDVQIWHPATEPVSAAEVYQYLTGNVFLNELANTPAYYNYRTVHERLFNGKNGYIASKDQILQEIKGFVESC